jgi:3-demethoxyubiquinol 3-hydroxylase
MKGAAVFDVVIVGGGMVGASLALKFSQNGLKVALLEKTTAPQLAPDAPVDLRVSAINLRSEQWLTEINAWQAIPVNRLCPYLRLQTFEATNSQTDSPELTFTAAEIKQPHLGHIIENNQIQAALWQQFPKEVSVFCPVTIRSLQQESTYASVQTAEFGDIRGRLFIAADGGTSQLRTLAGIGCNGWQYQQGCLVATVETEYGQQDITWQQFTEQGPRAFLPLPGAMGSLVWYDSQARVKQLASLSAADLASQIQQHFPAKLGKVNVVQQSWFPLTRMHANRYSAGRVVLVGDAAHTINPLAGQGVNLGFADAKVLAELVLTAIAAGKDPADPTLLAQYEQQRKNANLLMMSAMDGFYQLFSSDWPLVRFARKAGLSLAANAGPLKAWVGAYAAGLK